MFTEKNGAAMVFAVIRTTFCIIISAIFIRFFIANVVKPDIINMFSSINNVTEIAINGGSEEEINAVIMNSQSQTTAYAYGLEETTAKKLNSTHMVVNKTSVDESSSPKLNEKIYSFQLYLTDLIAKTGLIGKAL